MDKKTLCAAALALGAFSIHAFAHHSFAMFDQSRRVSLTGSVVDFQWTNPHAFIHVQVPEPDPLAGTWEIEMNSPNNLKREGWKTSSVKVGDKVTVLANPLRDPARKGGLFIAVTLPDGTVLGSPAQGPINIPVPAAPKP